MRKPRVLLLSIMIALFMTAAMIGPTQKAKAGFQEWNYSVYFGCVDSRTPYGTLVGEWTIDCNDNWTGWGDKPGDECTYFDVTPGQLCGIEQSQ